MAEPFLSEIRLMSFVFPPKGWAQCNGQLLPINQNQALFSLLGTTYGGDGRVNFGLPDLRGRSPLHVGAGRVLGERGGEQAHALSQSELPAHSHTLSASADVANTHLPGTALPAAKPRGGINRYAAAGSADAALHPGSLTSVGGNQAHLNMQPFLTLNFCIALQGIFPSRN
jgi:microcystin-dependent protein